MADFNNQAQSSKLTSTGDAEAINYLKHSIGSGKHWYIALLEVMGMWSSAKETRGKRTYCYLIDGEAFDWLLLAERLCETVDGLLPDEEKIALLFHGKPPVDLTQDEFKELIGNSKYRQYLNYFYGITIEESLILAVLEEVRKERHVFGSNEDETTEEAYRRIYGLTDQALLERFRADKNYPQVKALGLTQLKEFTYWLFKFRLQHCDKAKVASDTKKALERLRQHSGTLGFSEG